MAKQYIEPEKRYEDQQSTGVVFSGMGAVGTIGAILCIMDIIKLPFGDFQEWILLLMFAACFFFGIGSLIHASKIKQTISSENAKVADMRQWIAENRSSFCTEETLDLPSNEAYFQREEEIRNAILAKFPEIDESLLDIFVEETYQALYE